MPAQKIEFLLNAPEPWVVYRTLLDLLGLPETDRKVADAKAKLLQHPLVKGLIEEMQDWPGTVLSSHKSAGQLYHKLSFLADLGLIRQIIRSPLPASGRRISSA